MPRILLIQDALHLAGVAPNGIEPEGCQANDLYGGSSPTDTIPTPASVPPLSINILNTDKMGSLTHKYGCVGTGQEKSIRNQDLKKFRVVPASTSLSTSNRAFSSSLRFTVPLMEV